MSHSAFLLSLLVKAQGPLKKNKTGNRKSSLTKGLPQNTLAEIHQNRTTVRKFSFEV